MDSLERCRILLGLSADNEPKMAIVSICLEKAREDICEFCRDTFIDDDGMDVFPSALKSIQEDLALARYRKLGAEGQTSYRLSDEQVNFEDKLPQTVKEQLYRYRRLFPRTNVAIISDANGGGDNPENAGENNPEDNSDLPSDDNGGDNP